MEISMKHLKTYVLDRYEGSYGVLEDQSGRLYDVLRDELPPDVREGDVLHESEGAYVVDQKATEEKRESLRRISEELSNNG